MWHQERLCAVLSLQLGILSVGSLLCSVAAPWLPEVQGYFSVSRKGAAFVSGEKGLNFSVGKEKAAQTGSGSHMSSPGSSDPHSVPRAEQQRLLRTAQAMRGSWCLLFVDTWCCSWQGAPAFPVLTSGAVPIADTPPFLFQRDIGYCQGCFLTGTL